MSKTKVSKTKMLEKSISNTNIVKILQINNIFFTNILMFCNRKSINKSLNLLYLEK